MENLSKEYKTLLSAHDSFTPLLANKDLLYIPGSKNKSLTVSLNTLRYRWMWVDRNSNMVFKPGDVAPLSRPGLVEASGYSIDAYPKNSMLIDILPFSPRVTEKTLHTMRNKLVPNKEAAENLRSTLERMREYAGTSTTAYHYTQPLDKPLYEQTTDLFDNIKEVYPSKSEQIKWEINLLITQQLDRLTRRLQFNYGQHGSRFIGYRQQGSKTIIKTEPTADYRFPEFIVYDPTENDVIDQLRVYRYSSTTEKVSFTSKPLSQQKYAYLFAYLTQLMDVYDIFQSISAVSYDPTIELIQDIYEAYKCVKEALFHAEQERKQLRIQKKNAKNNSILKRYDASKEGHYLFPLSALQKETQSPLKMPAILTARNIRFSSFHQNTQVYRGTADVHIATYPVGKNKRIFFVADENGKNLTELFDYAIYERNSENGNMEYTLYSHTGKRHTFYNAPSTISYPWAGTPIEEHKDYLDATANAIQSGIEWLMMDPVPHAGIERLRQELIQQFFYDPFDDQKVQRLAQASRKIRLIYAAYHGGIQSDLLDRLESYVKQVPYDPATIDSAYYDFQDEAVRASIEGVAFDTLFKAVLQLRDRYQNNVSIAQVEDYLTQHLTRDSISEPYTLKNSLLKTFQWTKQLHHFLLDNETGMARLPHTVDVGLSSNYNLNESVSPLHAFSVWSAFGKQHRVLKLLGNAHSEHSILQQCGVQSDTDWRNLIPILGIQLQQQRKLNIEKILRFAQYLRDEECFADIGYTEYGSDITPNLGTAFISWMDHLYLSIKVGVDLTKDNLFYPRNLLTQHRRLQLEDQKREHNINHERFHTVVEKYRGYEASYDDYIIKIADSDKALKEESKTLGHCVYTYSNAVSNERSVIFFLRAKDAPDKPLVTVEVDPNTVTNGHFQLRQQEGRMHRPPTAEEQAIINDWQQTVLRADRSVTESAI